MKLENQVTPLQQAKRLDELGVNVPSAFLWYKANNGYEVILNDNIVIFDSSYFAYSVAELGVMLPDYIASDALYTYQQRRGNMDRKYPAKHEVSYWNLGNKILSTFKSDSEAEARAAMLIYLLETGITTPAEVNERLKQN